MARKFAKYFHQLVQEIITDNDQRDKMFGALRIYQSSQDLKQLLSDLKQLLDEPQKLELYEYIRPLILLRHQLEYSYRAPAIPGLRLRTVRLFRTHGKSLGFGIRGGFEFGVGVFVSTVEHGSQAEEQGLKVGDEIIRVNGFTIAEAIHEDVLKLIKSRDEVVLKVTHIGMLPVKEQLSHPLIWKYVEDMESKPALDEVLKDYKSIKGKYLELKIFIDSTGINSIGCGILSGPPHYPGIFVEKVRPGSLAEEVGFEVGDQIKEVNEKSFLGISHNEAVVVLKSSKQLNVVICKRAGLPLFEKRQQASSNRSHQVGDNSSISGSQRSSSKPTIGAKNWDENQLIAETLNRNQLFHHSTSSSNNTNTEQHSIYAQVHSNNNIANRNSDFPIPVEKHASEIPAAPLSLPDEPNHLPTANHSLSDEFKGNSTIPISLPDDLGDTVLFALPKPIYLLDAKLGLSPSPTLHTHSQFFSVESLSSEDSEPELNLVLIENESREPPVFVPPPPPTSSPPPLYETETTPTIPPPLAINTASISSPSPPLPPPPFPPLSPPPSPPLPPPPPLHSHLSLMHKNHDTLNNSSRLTSLNESEIEGETSTAPCSPFTTLDSLQSSNCADDLSNDETPYTVIKKTVKVDVHSIDSTTPTNNTVEAVNRNVDGKGNDDKNLPSPSQDRTASQGSDFGDGEDWSNLPPPPAPCFWNNDFDNHTQVTSWDYITANDNNLQTKNNAISPHKDEHSDSLPKLSFSDGFVLNGHDNNDNPSSIPKLGFSDSDDNIVSPVEKAMLNPANNPTGDNSQTLFSPSRISNTVPFLSTSYSSSSAAKTPMVFGGAAAVMATRRENASDRIPQLLGPETSNVPSRDGVSWNSGLHHSQLVHLFSALELNGRELKSFLYSKDRDLGIEMEGGIGTPLAGKIVVAAVFDGGVAIEHGIQTGDQLMMINGTKLTDLTIAQAEQILKEAQTGPQDKIQVVYTQSAFLNNEECVTYF